MTTDPAIVAAIVCIVVAGLVAISYTIGAVRARHRFQARCPHPDNHWLCFHGDARRENGMYPALCTLCGLQLEELPRRCRYTGQLHPEFDPPALHEQAALRQEPIDGPPEGWSTGMCKECGSHVAVDLSSTAGVVSCLNPDCPTNQPEAVTLAEQIRRDQPDAR